MTRDETKNILDVIMRAYPRMRIVETKEDVDLWHECLEDLDYPMARKATINLVKTEKDFPPDIATIREEYDSLKRAATTQHYAVKNEFERCRNYYPGSGSIDNGWPEFQERLKNVKEGMRIEAARYLANKVIGYVHECEKNGTDTIDFAECIKTVGV